MEKQLAADNGHKQSGNRAVYVVREEYEWGSAGEVTLVFY